MMSLHDREAMDRALTLDLDPRLLGLLAERIGSFRTATYDLTTLTHILVIEPGDTETDIQDEIGLSPLINPIDGSRFGSTSFVPFHDWLHDHGSHFELVITIGNSGFAYVLLIADQAGVPDDLLAMCREASR